MNRHVDVDGRIYRAVGSSFAAYHPGWEEFEKPDGSLTYTRHADGTSVTLTPVADGTIDATFIDPHERVTVVEGFQMNDLREAAWRIVPSVIDNRESLQESGELPERDWDRLYPRGSTTGDGERRSKRVERRSEMRLERLNESKRVEYVENQYGDEYPFDDVMLELMDDDIRERVHDELAPCSAQEFFDRYCELHRKKFGEDFVFQEKNPQY